MSKSRQEYESEIARLTESVQRYQTEIVRLREQIAELKKSKPLLFQGFKPFGGLGLPELSDREWVIQQYRLRGRECPEEVLRKLKL